MTDTNATPNPREVAAENDRFRRSVMKALLSGQSTKRCLLMRPRFMFVEDESSTLEVARAVIDFATFDPRDIEHRTGIVQVNHPVREVAFAIVVKAGEPRFVLGYPDEMRDAGYLPN